MNLGHVATENPPFLDDFPIETSVLMRDVPFPCLITGGYIHRYSPIQM